LNEIIFKPVPVETLKSSPRWRCCSFLQSGCSWRDFPACFDQRSKFWAHSLCPNASQCVS